VELVQAEQSKCVLLELVARSWWAVNVPVRGYNETLITYILGAGSAAHSIPVEVLSAGLG